MVKTESKVAVIGVGNILLQDEGVGIHIVNALIKDYRFDPPIEIVDGGTTGMDLIPYFEENDKIIIVDAVNFDKEPGFIGSIENEDILTVLTTKLTMHHLGLTDVLSTMKVHDIKPEQMFLLGIQPDSLELDMELTDVIANRIPRMMEVLQQKLAEWGVKSEKITRLR